MGDWGTAQEQYVLTNLATVGGADVAVPAATETTVITSGAIFQPVPGPYYPLVDITLAILLGATPPTAMVIAFKIGAGSDVATYTLPPAILVANATVLPGVTLAGLNSKAAWVSPGSTINITVNATGQAVTCKNVGSVATVSLVRGLEL